MKSEHFIRIDITVGSGAGELYQKLMEFPEGHPYGWILDRAEMNSVGIVLIYKEENNASYN